MYYVGLVPVGERAQTVGTGLAVLVESSNMNTHASHKLKLWTLQWQLQHARMGSGSSPWPRAGLELPVTSVLFPTWLMLEPNSLVASMRRGG